MTPIKAGPHKYVSRGVTISVDQELSRERVDVLVGLMSMHGFEPRDILEAHFVGDGVIFRTLMDLEREIGMSDTTP